MTKNWLWLVLVFMLLGGWLRLFRIEEKMRFIWDEGRDMLAIRRMIVDRDLLLLGPFNEQDNRRDFFGVFHYYLMAPALWAVDLDPVGPAVFTAGLGILSIGLVYWLVKEWESPLMGLLVAGLYAVSPLVIRYVQWPWNPNTVPFFGLLYCLAIIRIHKANQWYWQLIAGLLLGLLFQLHYFTIALAAWWLVVMWFKKLTWKQWLGRLGLFFGGWLLPNLSFVLFDLRNEFFLRKILVDSFASGGSQQLFEPSWQSVIALWNYLVNITAGLFGTDPMVGMIITAFWLASGVWYSRQAVKEKHITLPLLVVSTWIILLAILALFPSTADDYHSSYLWFGVLFIAVKAVSELFHTKLDIWLAGLLYLMLVGHLIKANDLWREPQWSENLPMVKSIGRLISEDVQTNTVESFSVVDLSTADSKATRYRYFLAVNETEPLHPDKYPEAEVLYAISQQPIETRLTDPIWELASFAEEQYSLIGIVNEMYVYKLVKIPQETDL